MSIGPAKLVRAVLARSRRSNRSSFLAFMGLVGAVGMAQASLFGAVLAQSGPTRPTATCIGVDYDEHADPKVRESACLSELRNSVTRKGALLTLKLENGATKTFLSNPTACQNDDASHCADYRVIGYHAAARLYLIRGQGYQEHECALVRARDGKVTTLANVPHFAPDGATFILVNDNATTIRPFDLAIGSITADGPALVWQRPPNDSEAFEFQRWIDNDRIAFVVRNLDQKGNECPQRKCDAVLVRFGAGWTTLRLPPRQD
ncbi:MAG: hypothetical protein ACLPKB_30945 [Xanthobacteraceae bacterium]